MIKVPVTIKAKLTESLRKKIIEDLNQNISNVNLELDQIAIEEKRVIAEQAQGDLQRLQAIRQHFGIERQKREAFKAEAQAKIEDARKLAEGAEIIQGTMEREVELKVGDNFREVMNVEVVIEDDKVIAIRG